MTWNRSTVLRILPLLFALLAYANTLGHGFAFDDAPLLVRNPHIRSLGEIPSFFASSKVQADSDMKIYRPLRQAGYALQYSLFGLNPLGYHAVSVLLHCANVLLLSFLFTRLGFSDIRAFAGAVLFAVHPLATESVANITGQTDLLFLLFYLTALAAAVRPGDGQGRFGAAVLVLSAYVLSLLSKEMAISFLPLLLALDIYRYRGDAGSYRARVPLYAGGALLTVLYLFVRSRAVEGAWDLEYYGDSFWITMFTETKVILTYLRLFVVPFPQSARYDVALVETPFNVSTVAVVVLLVGLVVCTVRSLRRGGHLTTLLGFWWFAITLLPVSNLYPIPASMMGERFLYLPMIGLIIALVSLEIPAATEGRIRVAVRGAGAVVLAVLLAMTMARNRVWKDNLTLFEDTRKRAPDSLVVHAILGQEYLKRGDTARAELEYGEMLRINVQAAREHLRRARVYKEQGRIADAERMARKALWTKPDFEEAKAFLQSLGAVP